MTKNRYIKRTVADFDRIEWLDAKHRTHSVRVAGPDSVSDIAPRQLSRRAGKWVGQQAHQGYYWCAGMRAHVWHESMNEFSSLMLIDHLHDLAEVLAQPLLLTFADGSHHHPDFLVTQTDGSRWLLDVHVEAMTTEADKKKFKLTAGLCERVGWTYELLDAVTNTERWNLELLARWAHPRFAPSVEEQGRLLALADSCRTFGELRSSANGSFPAAALPAIYHLMWKRRILFALDLPFTDNTLIEAA